MERLIVLLYSQYFPFKAFPIENVTPHAKMYTNDLSLKGLKCWLPISHLLRSIYTDAFLAMHINAHKF